MCFGYGLISTRRLAFFTFFSLLIIAGCGGGGSSQPAEPEPPPIPTTYAISVATNPSAVETSVGMSADSAISWSFSASPVNSNLTSYSVSTTTPGVEITGGTGSVVPGTSINTQLTYSCTSARTTEAQLILAVRGVTETVVWSIICSREQIETPELEDVQVSLGGEALTTLIWRFSTTGDTSRTFNYEVTSDSQNLVISNPTGSMMAATDIQSELRFNCSEMGVHQLMLNIAVGSATTQIPWTVVCTVEQIEVTPLDDIQISLNRTDSARLIWKFTSTGDASTVRNYQVTSESPNLAISDEGSTGMAAVSTDVQIEIQYTCSQVGVHQPTLTIMVGSATSQIQWSVTCTEEQIDIAPLMAIQVSNNQSAQAILSWQFSTSGSTSTALDYEVTSDIPGVQISNSVGIATANTAIRHDLQFTCKVASVNEIVLRILVGSATSQIQWSVTCTEEQIDITPLDMIQISINQSAEAMLSWQFTTSGSTTTALDYEVTSAVRGVQISNSIGTAPANTTISNDLQFDCKVASANEIVLRIKVGSGTTQVTWFVTCTEEHINVSPIPDVEISNTFEASATLTWLFDSTGDASTARDYQVESDADGLQISNATGSANPGTTIQSELSYRCSDVGVHQLPLRLQVGSASSEVSWTVTCTNEEIAISSLEDVRVPLNEEAVSELVWQFSTTGDETTALNYAVYTNTRGVQISNSSSSATPSTEIKNELRYQCTTQEFNNITLNITVGNASSQVTWVVACAVEEDIEIITASFHQGPLIAQMVFTFTGSQWQTDLIPQSYRFGTLRMGTNRLTFGTFSFDTPERSEIELSLSPTNPRDAVDIRQVDEVSFYSNPNYTNKTVFSIEYDDLSTAGPLQLIIDPLDAIPERNENNNSILFDLNDLSTVRLPTLDITFVPIISSAGSPNLSNLTPYIDTIYEYLPMSSIRTSIREAIDVTQLGEFDHVAALTVLNRVWQSEATLDQFYHGIYVRPQDVDVCGSAVVQGNVGMSSVITRECPDRVIAHELGHNLTLRHAPACGAEDRNPDPDYPYVDGSIGTENGWFLRRVLPVGNALTETTATVYDIMSYCSSVFTSRYSYGKAADYFVNNVLLFTSAAKIPQAARSGFVKLENQSRVLSGYVTEFGEWILEQNERVANKPMRPPVSGEFLLEVIHGPSGTLLHQEKIQPKIFDHGVSGEKLWGARVPEFASDNVYIQIKNKSGHVLIEIDASDADSQKLLRRRH